MLDVHGVEYRFNFCDFLIFSTLLLYAAFTPASIAEATRLMTAMKMIVYAKPSFMQASLSSPAVPLRPFQATAQTYCPQVS
jgi:hypothetical protein